jgi:hypothetical protein
MLNNVYGISDGIVNLVKNEMGKTELISERDIYNKAALFFPNDDFNVIDISDLIYHLKA